MPRGVDCAETQAIDGDRVSVRHADRDDVGLGFLAHDRYALGAVAQLAEARDVIGMQMRVDGLNETQIEFVQELDVALDLLEHRIDDKRLAARPACKEVAVGARNRCRTSGGKIMASFDR